MKPFAFACTLRRAGLLAAAGLVALLLGGCGGFNDDVPGQLQVQVRFPDALGGGSTTQSITGPVASEPVLSLVVGGLIVEGNKPYQSTDVRSFESPDRNQIRKEVLNSGRYMTVIQLPYASDRVAFRMPPDGAGNWQIAAIGTRDRIDNVSEFGGDPDLPIFYGFTDRFLNGAFDEDATYTLQMEPACGLPSPPVPPC